MAVAAEKQREKVKTAFIIPASTLINAWSEIVSLNASPTTKNN